ncbi:hypothetical protein F441_14724 [Phytophthora nicotianae CJ01A1]|uniref:Uncharacterized protein n=2 Tax=Phytophthora nicotianae TaxID=4792 RepID=W2YR76_PHYNI|nr:hypothetical protein F441_14724 [Phytophthora nicotianae CJ01A1]ETP37456.1 hypothetical protein F442_14744 [Phytophthora nicotianae P10297]
MSETKEGLVKFAECVPFDDFKVIYYARFQWNVSNQRGAKFAVEGYHPGPGLVQVRLIRLRQLATVSTNWKGERRRSLKVAATTFIA